jgi:acyltransferase
MNSQISSKTNRIEYIDIAKGLGMIFVVIGHCINGKTFPGLWIWTFHMPLFFILSGICFSENKYPQFLFFLKKRIQTLFLPCIYFSILVTVFTFILLDKTAFQSLTKNLPGVLWFVSVLFFTEILYYYILRLTPKKILRIFTLISLLLLGIWFCRKEIILPFSVSTIPIATFYYGIGHSYKVLINKIASAHNSLLKISTSSLLLILPAIVTYHSKKSINMSTNYFSQPEFLYLFLSISGSLGIILLATFHWRYVKKLLLYIGRNTFIILSFHMLFIALSAHYIQPFINNGLIYKFIEQVVIWVSIFISINFINKKIAWILGK